MEFNHKSKLFFIFNSIFAKNIIRLFSTTLYHYRYLGLKILLVTSLLLSIMIVNISVCTAQHPVEQTSKLLLQKIQKSKADTNRVNLMLKLSRFYVNTKGDLDSSLLITKQALNLSERLKNEKINNDVIESLVAILIRRNEITKASPYFNGLIDSAKKHQNLSEEARIYYRIARSISTKNPENIPLKIRYFQKSTAVYKKSNQFKSEVNARSSLASLYVDLGKLDEAEKEYFLLLADAKSRGFKDLEIIYYGLGDVYAARNDTKKETYYKLQSLHLAEAAEPTHENDQLKNLLYTNLGRSYLSLKMYHEAEEVAIKGINLSRQIEDFDMYYTTIENLINALLSQKKNNEALAASLKAIKDVPPGNNFQQKLITGLIGKSYVSLNQGHRAEPYFIAMDKSAQNMVGEFGNSALLNDHMADHYLTMSEFYLFIKNYDKAASFVSKFNALDLKSFFTAHKMRATDIQITIDTAKGDFRSAFIQAMLYKSREDSISNKYNARSVAEMMVKYESQKKDQDILLRQQNIDLLKKQKQIQDNLLMKAALEIRLEKQQRIQQQQLNSFEKEKRDKDFKLFQYAAERKDNRISLLQKKSELQKASLDSANLLRNMTFFGLAFTFLIIGLLYNGYRLKRANSSRLTLQKNEIDLKNRSLKKLVDEKEWLLKEVNHRVKNNLQIVMSLLHNQSFYMQDSAALLAIKDSSHRVHTISLIHKKLYQGNNIGSIHMPDYIRELVSYLKQSFSIKQQIIFEVNVDEISLDSTQAVPLGLILNEAITNCIKYAFPLEKTGVISVALIYLTEDQLQIKIADNGIGLPEEFDENFHGSLGISMIRGLSNDLGGNCRIDSLSGTTITIEFPYNRDLLRNNEIDSIKNV